MRAVVADVHPLFREAMILLLQDLAPEMEIIKAVDFNNVFDHVNRLEGAVDFIFLDLDMPGMSWRQAVYELVARSMSVVVVSATTDRDVIEDVMAMGASGYIPKSSSGDLMRAALQLIFAGGFYLPAANLMSGPSQRSFSRLLSSEKASGDLRNLLTKRQLDVLSKLAGGQSNKEIAHSLNLAEGTVKLHVTAILRSLGVSNRTQAVMAAWRSGITAEENSAQI